jgi:putative oxidoreductase
MTELLPPQADTALWVVQGLLVFVFLAAGLFKTTQPIAKLAAHGPWVASYPAVIVRLIGVTEILCALSLLLVGLFHFTTLLTPVVPSDVALFITTFLTPIAASLVALIMAGATATHLPRKEYGLVVVTALLLVLALVTIVARLALPLA